jgi:signal recognition particle subunit SRP54
MDERQLTKVEAIICSMTRQERSNHNTINMARRKRISRGSGTRPSDVNRLLKQFAQMRKMMKKMSAMGDPGQAMQAMQMAKMPRGMLPG